MQGKLLIKVTGKRLILMQRERKDERETQWARESSLIELLFTDRLLCARHWQYSYDENGQSPALLELTVGQAVK